jgi:hypothetical protein
MYYYIGCANRPRVGQFGFAFQSQVYPLSLQHEFKMDAKHEKMKKIHIKHKLSLSLASS